MGTILSAKEFKPNSFPQATIPGTQRKALLKSRLHLPIKDCKRVSDRVHSVTSSISNTCYIIDNAFLGWNKNYTSCGVKRNWRPRRGEPSIHGKPYSVLKLTRRLDALWPGAYQWLRVAGSLVCPRLVLAFQTRLQWGAVGKPGNLSHSILTTAQAR